MRRSLPRSLAAVLLVSAAARGEAPATSPPPPVAAAAPAAPASSASSDRPVLLVHDGRETLVGADEAARGGYTPVSLRDDWTPYIFREPVGEGGALLQNRYRSTYLGLAGDRSDED